MSCAKKKYGLLTTMDGIFNCNFGDYIQSLSIEYLYTFLGIPPKNIYHISLKEMKCYDGEELILPINYASALLFDFKTGKPQLSKKIRPLILGLSLHDAQSYCEGHLAPEILEYLRRNAPIGCRDEYTRQVMDIYGIPAYLQGCITNVLPRRPIADYQDVVLIDCQRNILSFVPNELLKNSVILSAVPENAQDRRNCWSKAQEYYAYLCGNAKLVVSTRFHAVTPCNAMGIPSIFVRRVGDGLQMDYRLDCLNPHISAYSFQHFSEINWNPDSESYEDIKEIILRMAVSRLKYNTVNQEDVQAIRDFYQPSIHFFETHFTEFKSDRREWESRTIHRAQAKLSAAKGFYIWGAKPGYIISEGGKAKILDDIISVNPKLCFKGWIDTYQKGTLMGKPILAPNQLSLYKDDIVIVAADSAVKAALAQFRKMGVSSNNYIICAIPPITDQDVLNELSFRKTH